MIPDESSEELSDTDEEVKNVYANFGFAIYAAQCLEHGLVNSFIYLDLIPSKRDITKSPKDRESSVDAFASAHFEHTLGRMIGDLKKVTSVSPDLSEKLSKALEMRNWLAHHYFRERAQNFLISSGRKNMIFELQQAVNMFREADEHLSVTLNPLLEKYGITEESIARISQEMLSKK